jgi:hypothetical protein
VAEETKPPPDKLQALAEARYQAVLKIVGCEILGKKLNCISILPGLSAIAVMRKFLS